ncbi:hypothetical protein BH10PSE19_BH10PSE19_01340 [soil metagenome]
MWKGKRNAEDDESSKWVKHARPRSHSVVQTDDDKKKVVKKPSTIATRLNILSKTVDSLAAKIDQGHIESASFNNMTGLLKIFYKNNSKMGNHNKSLFYNHCYEVGLWFITNIERLRNKVSKSKQQDLLNLVRACKEHYSLPQNIPDTADETDRIISVLDNEIESKAERTHPVEEKRTPSIAIKPLPPEEKSLFTYPVLASSYKTLITTAHLSKIKKSEYSAIIANANVFFKNLYEIKPNINTINKPLVTAAIKKYLDLCRQLHTIYGTKGIPFAILKTSKPIINFILQLCNPSTRFGYASALTIEDLTTLFIDFPADLMKLIIHGTTVETDTKLIGDEKFEFSDAETKKADKIRVFYGAHNTSCGYDNAYEHPKRFASSLTELKETNTCIISKVTTPDTKDIHPILSKVHIAAHIHYLETMATIGEHVGCSIAVDIGDPWNSVAETFIDRPTLSTARQGVVAAVTAVHALLASADYSVAMCITRPPGHHASSDFSQGFCIFNNALVAVITALEAGKKVVLVDFDLHYGDGSVDVLTQFLKKYPQYIPNVKFYELHAPVWGCHDEKKEEASPTAQEGVINRCTLAGGSKGEDLITALEKLVDTDVTADLVIHSAGFDGHKEEVIPGGKNKWKFSSEDYGRIVHRIAELFPKSRHLVITEGGYVPTAINASLIAIAKSLSNQLLAKTTASKKLTTRSSSSSSSSQSLSSLVDNHGAFARKPDGVPSTRTAAHSRPCSGLSLVPA